MTPRSSDPADRERPDIPGRASSGRADERSRGRRSTRASGPDTDREGPTTDAGGAVDAERADRSSPAASSSARTSSTTTPTGREPVPFTQVLGRITVVALAVLFGVFAVANSQSVTFSWVFGATEVQSAAGGDGQVGGVPLIILLVASFVIGGAVGMLLEWQLVRGRRRRRGTG